MFPRCDNCGWTQDDCWSEGYNPFRSLLDWEGTLLNDELDRQFSDEPAVIRETGDVTVRELLARECEIAAARIRQMQYRTFQDAKEAGNQCPLCKSKLVWD